MPLQQRVHWGRFCRPVEDTGMGLPSLGIGERTGDLRLLILSVGDIPEYDDKQIKKIELVNSLVHAIEIDMKDDLWFRYTINF